MSDYKVSVTITGNASSFQKAFSIANDTVDKFNKKTSSISGKVKSLGDSFNKVGGKLTKSITAPALTATTALTSLTLVKGFNRLTGIDDAKAKLKGLGHDAKTVDEIMNSALTSVKGTSYGMDEAATTAASAVAAGIKPGKELTRYLSLTADAAAIAGSSMGDMGSIINKVQTAQVAYTDNLNQLADRGIPIYEWLGDEAGVAAAEVKDMAKDGEISSEMFLKAIEKNIGGAAKTIGENSFKATIENIGASISRIGANFLDAGGKGGGFFSTLKPLLVDFNNSLGVLEDKAADLGKEFGANFNAAVKKIEEIKSKFDKLSPSMQSTILSSAGVGAALVTGLGPGISVVGKVLKITGTLTGGFENAASGVGNAFSNMKNSFSSLKNSSKGLIGDFKNLAGGILQPIAPLISKASGSVKGLFEKMWSSVTGVFNRGASVISNGFGTLIGNIGLKFPKLTGAIAAFETNSKGMFSRIGGSITGILQKVGSFAPTFFKGFGIAAGIGVVFAGLGLLQQGFGDKIDGILQMVSEKGPEIITEICDGIVKKLPTLIEQGTKLVDNLLNAITANLPSLLSGGAAILTTLVTSISARLPTLIPTAVDLIITLANGLIDNLPAIITAGLYLIIALVRGLIDAIPKLIDAAPELISNLISGIVKMLPEIITTGIKLITQLAVGLIQAIPQLVAAIPEIISSVKDAFSQVDWGEIGRNIIDGIKNGLKSVASNLVQAAKDVGRDTLDGVKRKLKIHSPSRVFRDEVGQMMALGLGIGFENNIPIKSMTGSVADAIKDVTTSSISLSADLNRTDLSNSTKRMIEDVSLSYGQSFAASTDNYKGFDSETLGDYIITMASGQMQMIADALERGIGSIRMTADKRQIGRMVSDLGFAKG